MSIVDRKYWLLSIAAGLAVGLLGMLAMIDTEDAFDLAHFVGPTLFGTVFVYCLRSTAGINWWRGLCLLLGIVAAHWGAYFLAVNSARIHSFAFFPVLPFTYGAIFGLTVAALAAVLFPTTLSGWLVVRTVLAPELVALSYWPLAFWIVPAAGPSFTPPPEGYLFSFLSHTAAWVTFGLVYAVVAALLGWRLFQKRTGGTS